jgi:hypothetical protein
MKCMYLAWVALAGFGSGCLAITPADGVLQCSTVGNQCPKGYYCASDRTCWHVGKAPGGGGDGGSADMAGQPPADLAQPVVPCMVPSECPAPSMPCLLSACIGGTCALVAAPPGVEVPAAQQVPNDCQKLVCDNNGKAMAVADTTDLPLDPTGGCNTPSCNGPTARLTPTMIGTACTQISNGICNGAGVCGECKPGTTECVGTTTSRNQCSPAGKWEALTPPCPNACSAGVCTGSCATGTPSMCANSTTLNVCTSNTWVLTNCNVSPTTVCYNNACTGTCQPTPSTCNNTNNALVGCDASGTPVSMACPAANPYCLGSACVPCQPNATRCAPGMAGYTQTCDATGNWGTATACGTAAGAVYSCANSGVAPTLAACTCSDPAPPTCGTWQCGTVRDKCGNVTGCGAAGDGSCAAGYRCSTSHTCVSATGGVVTNGCCKCGKYCC